jgi:thioredoxin-dependent peroxiredoxin
VGGDARKAYSIPKHLFGPSTRTTFVIDKTGTVRFVFHFYVAWNLLTYLIYRAVLDATVNFSAHAKFVNKELDKLEAEGESAVAKDEVVPAPEAAATAATEQPEPEANEAAAAKDDSVAPPPDAAAATATEQPEPEVTAA